MQREESWGADPLGQAPNGRHPMRPKQTACGNLMIIGHSQAGKWR
jgi:hypothetical protein